MAFFGLFGKKITPAPTLISPMQNLFRDYPEDTITPVRYKYILKQADLGWTYEFMQLLDACATDYKVSSVLRARKLAVAAADWTVEPGEDSDAARAIADETKEFLCAIPDFTQMKFDLLDAHYRGFSCGRAQREIIEGREMVVDWEPIESRFFRFENGIEPLITTLDNSSGVPLPPEYLYHVVRDKPGPATRGGTGRSIAKVWVYKGYFIIDMASFVEKNAQPHVQVKVPLHYVEGSTELERAKSAARSLIADNIGLVPADVEIELLESIKQSSTVKDTYLAAVQWADEAIAQAELGHTLSSAGSTVGGLGHGGEADQAGDVKQEILCYDASGLSQMLNHQLIWPRTVRMYGDKAPLPRICIDVEEPEDEVAVATANKLRAETIAILKSAGLDISKAQVYEEFELEEPNGEDDILVGEQPDPGAQPDPNATPPNKAK